MTEPLSLLTFSLQGILAALVLEGVRRRDVSAVVNALGSLGAALAPSTVEVVLRSPAGSGGFGPELPLWIAVAGVLHSLGMLGLYESVPWWDHLAHAVSAALVAALIYAALVVVRHSIEGGGPPGGVGGTTVVLTLAVGVCWELVELVARDVGERFGVEPVLVHYGRRDTVLDLVFDLVGALLVVLFDLRTFVPIAERYPHATTVLVFGGGGIAVAGSILMAIRVTGGDDRVETG